MAGEMPEKKEQKPKNPHAGHRGRMRERYVRSGLDAFQDHEALELLLFYAIPMRDTNEIAHKMINKMGSLHNLMDASVPDIQRLCGCSESTAILLNLIPAMWKRYEMNKWEPRSPLDNSKKAAEYAKNLFIGETVECFYLICLNNQSQLIYPELLTRGTVNEVHFYSKDIVQAALKHNAASVIITHNHPSGYLKPSMEDQAATEAIVTALATIGVDVIDHIVIAGNKYLSFSEKRLYDFEGRY